MQGVYAGNVYEPPPGAARGDGSLLGSKDLWLGHAKWHHLVGDLTNLITVGLLGVTS